MFLRAPRVLAHKSADGLVTQDYIISGERLLNRICPHRFYPLGETGKFECGHEIECKLHGFRFDHHGNGSNNSKRLPIRGITPTKSGLIYHAPFVEPDHWWVDNIANETNLNWSSCFSGRSHGSWLWNYETALDLMHLRKGGIHPWLSRQMTIDQVKFDQGDGWCLQYFDGGFWLFVYPYSFVEWEPGCLSVVTVTPDHEDSEYGYSWLGQFYYKPHQDLKTILKFNRIDEVWNEDVAAAELIRRPFTPMLASDEPIEIHNVHFGKWYNDNK